MPVPCVPSLKYFCGSCLEVDRLFYLQLQDVEMVHRVPNLHEEPSSIIADLEQPTVDVDVATDIIELT